MGKYLDGTQVVEDFALAPVLLESIPFGTFTASATITRTYASKFTRNAKRRVLIFKSTLNQNLTTVKIYPWDSVAGAPVTLSGDSGTPGAGTITASTGTNVYTSATNPILGAPVDSFTTSVLVGATAPTSGTLEVYLIEIV